MITPGMVSVTFRDLSVERIVEVAAEAGLKAIEWGGDVHVQPGDVALAERVRRLTEDTGLGVSSYGSYYRLGEEAEPYPGFKRVVETSLALGAPTVRLWAGTLGSENAGMAYVQHLVDAARWAGDRAGEAGVEVAFEFHGHTVTDTAESARDFYEAVSHDNVCAYWQVDASLSPEERIDSLKLLTPWLSNVHVFHYEDGKQVALEQGAEEWRGYFAHVRALGGDRFALLEFVEDGQVENLLRDARTLARLVAE
jgi:sugar phosphate isomerase/epimerase